MNCGDMSWWREPDFKGLMERHGQAEHLVIQIDFLVQVARDARAEYSIPRASKSASGNTGYADIVSIASKELWEIKPKSLQDQAFKEASWYAKLASASCGPQWHAGKSYTASNAFGGGGVVYRIEGNGNKAELIAQQGRDGVVLYFWRVNGQEVTSLAPYFAWAIRQQIITDFFPSGPKPLPGAKSPDNLPPVKFKPPVLRPDTCIPQLRNLVPTLMKSIQTTCAQTIPDNGAVAILIEANVLNALVGQDEVAKTLRMMQVKPTTSTDRMFGVALNVLTRASGPNGAVAIALGLVRPILFTIAAAVVIGGVIVVTIEAAPLLASAAATVVAAEGLLGTFIASVAASQSLRLAMAAGAALVVFAIPRTSSADPLTPVAIDASFARLVVLKPGMANRQLGDSVTLDGAEWLVAGVARTGPD
jgi:hypothetical protein